MCCARMRVECHESPGAAAQSSCNTGLDLQHVIQSESFLRFSSIAISAACLWAKDLDSFGTLVTCCLLAFRSRVGNK